MQSYRFSFQGAESRLKCEGVVRQVSFCCNITHQNYTKRNTGYRLTYLIHSVKNVELLNNCLV